MLTILSFYIYVFFPDVAEASKQLTVYHGYLASSYHTGIISGLMLISSYMESVASSGKMVSFSTYYLGKLKKELLGQNVSSLETINTG